LEFIYFFQAEDGIRDFHVTGVQTCALPISVAADILQNLPLVHSQADVGWAQQNVPDAPGGPGVTSRSQNAPAVQLVAQQSQRPARQHPVGQPPDDGRLLFVDLVVPVDKTAVVAVLAYPSPAVGGVAVRLALPSPLQCRCRHTLALDLGLKRVGLTELRCERTPYGCREVVVGTTD